MQLKDLIYELEKLNARYPNAQVKNGFNSACSYRGDYSELCFTPSEFANIHEMLVLATSCVGKTFSGYKGGYFTMNNFSYCYLAKYGSTGEEITYLHIKDWENQLKYSDISKFEETITQLKVKHSDTIAQLQDNLDFSNSRLEAISAWVMSKLGISKVSDLTFHRTNTLYITETDLLSLIRLLPQGEWVTFVQNYEAFLASAPKGEHLSFEDWQKQLPQKGPAIVAQDP